MSSFANLLKEFSDKMKQDVETMEFEKYFQDNYSNNFHSWAYCYRLHAGINTNMHIERMHRTLKYLYLKGKHVKRLDKGINAIMKFIRDKLFDRIIMLNKGKVTSKLCNIRNRHKISLDLDPTLIKEIESGWEIPSTSAQNSEIYYITETNNDCTCELICTFCAICIHRYSCSCMDSSIKWNMCKHIHLLCKYRKEHNTDVQIIGECIFNCSHLCITGDNEETLTGQE